MSTPLWVGARHLVDDAAVFPPGNLPLPDAVRAHASYRRDPQLDGIVGPFVLRAADVGTALGHAAGHVEPLDISPIVLGASGITDALDDWAFDPRVRIAAFEVTATSISASDAAARLDSVAHTVVDERRKSRLDPGVAVFVEVGWEALQHGGAEVVARRANALGLGMKLRTGGVVAEAFPSEVQLGATILALVTAGAPFKCTAGLHHAVRHRDPTTGFEHHGFLNVLAATVLAGSGADEAAVSAAVSEQDADKVVATLVDASDDALADARASFRSYGSCSITEPVEELARLGLLASKEAV